MLEQRKLNTTPTSKRESPAPSPRRRLIVMISMILVSAPSIALEATPNGLDVAIREREAPSAAPEETPNVKGLARGLRKRVWYTAPTLASTPPTSTAKSTRGKRSSKITRRASGEVTRSARETGEAPYITARRHEIAKAVALTKNQRDVRRSVLMPTPE
jgi:hypothetical protein